MPIHIINPKEFDLPDDIVAVGNDLSVNTLKMAYQKGWFPWPEEELEPIFWFSPNPRGILKFENLHIPRSLQKVIRKNQFSVKTDTLFEDVIYECQTRQRKGQAGTWITDEMRESYIELHNAGVAHSVEIFIEDKLVGGLYGVFVKNAFSGESMFHSTSNVSKVALVKLSQALQSVGIQWIDTQMITPVIQSLGGTEVRRSIYYKMLEKNHSLPTISWNQVEQML